MTVKPKRIFTRGAKTIVEAIVYETVVVRKSKRLQKEPISVNSKHSLPKGKGAKRGKLSRPKRIEPALSVE